MRLLLELDDEHLSLSLCQLRLKHAHFTDTKSQQDLYRGGVRNICALYTVCSMLRLVNDLEGT